jgi:hypothetical protein
MALKVKLAGEEISEEYGLERRLAIYDDCFNDNVSGDLFYLDVDEIDGLIAELRRFQSDGNN